MRQQRTKQSPDHEAAAVLSSSLRTRGRPGTSLAPGVFVGEASSGDRAIVPASTGVAAFVGTASKGPLNKPITIHSYGDFEAIFGVLATDLSHAVRHFFLNGGGPAVIVSVGSDSGAAPPLAELIGSDDGHTGLYALHTADPFDLLLVPNQSDPAVHKAMIDVADRLRAFAILDMPQAVRTPSEAQTWLTVNAALQHRFAAAYFPRLICADPDQGGARRSFANSGAVAGVYARTDSQVGPWQAPAGNHATLNGVSTLDYLLTDDENGLINPLGLNALRRMPIFGSIVWGARTLAGADILGSQLKYIPVARMLLFLERTFEQALQWAVFEPNDEPLWANALTSRLVHEPPLPPARIRGRHRS